MSRNKTLQKTFLALLAGLILGLGPAQSVKAQFFGISLDTTIGYSTVKKGVIGGSVGITHPIPLVPNIGFSTLTFEELKEQQSKYASYNDPAIISSKTLILINEICLFTTDFI